MRMVVSIKAMTMSSKYIKSYISQRLIRLLVVSSVLVWCSACSAAGDRLNPYGESNTVEVLGSRDNSAITGGLGSGKNTAEAARHALEVAGSYRRTHTPEPAYPVVRPAVVRFNVGSRSS